MKRNAAYLVAKSIVEEYMASGLAPPEANGQSDHYIAVVLAGQLLSVGYFVRPEFLKQYQGPGQARVLVSDLREALSDGPELLFLTWSPPGGIDILEFNISGSDNGSVEMLTIPSVGIQGFFTAAVVLQVAEYCRAWASGEELITRTFPHIVRGDAAAWEALKRQAREEVLQAAFYRKPLNKVEPPEGAVSQLTPEQTAEFDNWVERHKNDD